MKFPRPTKRVGRCIAVIGTHYSLKGKIILDRRPRLKYDGEHWNASRLSFHLNVKHIPREVAIGNSNGGPEKFINKQVLHTCNHIWCVNPNHLYLGDHKDNGTDRWRDITPELRKQFKKKMQKICSDPEYRLNMSRATIGIRKPKSQGRKIRAAQKRLWSNRAYREKMSKAFRKGWRLKFASEPDFHFARQSVILKM